MIFKIGIFLVLGGIVAPIFSTSHFILWNFEYKEALRQYWINKSAGKPLSVLMQSAHFSYLIICMSGVLFFLGFLMVCVGYFLGV